MNDSIHLQSVFDVFFSVYQSCYPSFLLEIKLECIASSP